MIESILKLSEKDGDFQSKLSLAESSKLSISEFRSLAGLAEALAPLAELTDTLQTEFGTLGMVLPSIAEVCSLVTKNTTKYSLLIRYFAETLAKRF